MQDRELEAKAAEEKAGQHRQRAGELFAEHRKEGDEQTLSQAKEEMARADGWDKQAQDARSNDSRAEKAPGQSHESGPAGPAQGEAEVAGQSEWTDRRAWYLPGTAAEDPMLQAEEASQGGGILAQAATYAARSAFDKDHRTMDGAKMLGKAASAPGKALASAGQKILQQARQGKGAAGDGQRQGGHSQNGQRSQAQEAPRQERQRQQSQARERHGHER